MAQKIETTNAEKAAPGSRFKMSFEEFLVWDNECVSAEWVDGEVIVMSPASNRHQTLTGFLAALIQHFVESRDLGRAFVAPFLMKASPTSGGREPDVLFIANEHLDRLKENYLDGPADLAVEIISPDSRTRDRSDKFYEYEQAGVREYWLIDPLRKQAEFYVLGQDALYHPALPGDDGYYQSTVLMGLSLKTDWLWREPLPPLMSILREWKLV